MVWRRVLQSYRDYWRRIFSHIRHLRIANYEIGKFRMQQFYFKMMPNCSAISDAVNGSLTTFNYRLKILYVVGNIDVS